MLSLPFHVTVIIVIAMAMGTYQRGIRANSDVTFLLIPISSNGELGQNVTLVLVDILVITVKI